MLPVNNFSLAAKRGTIFVMEGSSLFIPKPNLPAPTVPWTSRDVAWALVMSVLLVLGFVILTGIGQRVGLFIDPSVVIIFGTSVLLIPVWYFSIYKYGVTWADLGLRGFRPAAVGMGCGLMLLSLLFNFVYASILALFDLQVQPDIAVMFEDTSFPFILLLGGAVVAPIVEEIFFRGFVFPGLRNRWDWKKAAAVSAGLFALAHVLPTSILPIFILGFIFAFLYQTSGSIWPAILMHMLTNTVALSAAYGISQGWVSLP